MRLAWFGKHFGEEPPLVGTPAQGAGGLFFAGCNLHCVFCQNYQISQQPFGQNYSVAEVAEIMLQLQEQDAVNIDLVTPTIWHQELIPAIALAKSRGLKIPIAWNSNSYEEVSLLKKMAGLVDIYLPDFKYADDDLAFKYSGIKNYSATALKALQEMLGQVGRLKIKNNLVQSGVIVRHLVLPNQVPNSLAVLDLLAPYREQIYFSFMSQYYPTFKAAQYPELNRPLTEAEFAVVTKKMLAVGLDCGWTQELSSAADLLPDFTKKQPF